MEDRACNSNSVTSFQFTGYQDLESIEVGDYNFMYVVRFVLSKLPKLKTLKIGKSSFTTSTSGYSDKSGSLSISDCPLLESIEIGSYSFSDYGGGTFYSNLDSLKTFILADYYSNSYSFAYSTLNLNGSFLICR